jgi:hypothetical protein
MGRETIVRIHLQKSREGTLLLKEEEIIVGIQLQETGANIIAGFQQ